MSTLETSFTDALGQEKPLKPYYQEHIEPKIAEFETKRIEALAKVRKFKNLAKLVIPTTTVIAAFLGYILTDKPVANAVIQPASATLIFSSILFFFLIFSVHTSFSKNIKDEIFPLIFKFFGNSYEYKSYKIDMHNAFNRENVQYIGKEDPLMDGMKPSAIIPLHTGRQYDDHIIGEYNNVGIEILEAELEKGKKNKKTVYAFRGLFIHFTMNKRFSGKTILKSDKGGLGNLLQDTFNQYENVKLEDPRFEEMFEVYGTDQIEARYLLTPALMERIVGLKNMFHGGKGKFQASFYDNRILLMIPSEKQFEVRASLNAPIDFVEEIETITTEMTQIFSIITQLKLDEETRV